MKIGLDERQEKEAEQIGMRGFYLMLFVCGGAILLQLLLWPQQGLKAVAGETAAVLVGGAYVLGASVKKGVWDWKGHRMSLSQHLVGSILTGAVASLFFSLMLIRKGAQTGTASKWGVGFFLGITVLCFLVSRGCEIAARKEEKKQEEKYEEL